MQIKTNAIILFLILLMIALSAYAYYEDLTDIGICIIGEGCSEVRHSVYSIIPLLNIKVSLFGLISSAILFLVFINKNKSKFLKKTFPILTFIGALFAIYFIYTQLFLIKAICSTCILIDITMLIIAALVLFTIRR